MLTVVVTVDDEGAAADDVEAPEVVKDVEVDEGADWPPDELTLCEVGD
jgi:hypothetical protein